MGFSMMVTLAVEEEGGSRDPRGRQGSELDRGTIATTCRGSCRVEEAYSITVNNLQLIAIICHFTC